MKSNQESHSGESSVDATANCIEQSGHLKSDRAEFVRQRLSSIGREFKKAQVECAELLTEVRAGGYWAATHDSFEAFVQQLLGITLRTAQEWMKVIRAFNEANVPTSEIVELGWSKVAVVAGQLNRDNAARLLQDVKEKTYAQLKEDIAAANASSRSGTKRTKDGTKQIVISDVLQDAIRRACMHTRDVDIESNLDFIACKFLELYPPPSRMPPQPSRN